MSAYYNENDPAAAQWLRELIKLKLITDGEVDDRSITEVRASDVAGFNRAHFFAGVGVWDYALTKAGWPEDRQVFTGSCPCQPFSVAGAGKGDKDERHLWPVWFDLINELQPEFVFGEQVASHTVVGRANGKPKAGDEPTWIDTVQADMERASYAFGFCVLPSCGVGAPHKRDRTWFVANAKREGLQRHGGFGKESVQEGRQGEERYSAQGGESCELANNRAKRRPVSASTDIDAQGWNKKPAKVAGFGVTSKLANTESIRQQQEHSIRSRRDERVGTKRQARRFNNSGKSSELANANGSDTSAEREQRSGEFGLQQEGCRFIETRSPDPNNSFWGDSDWLGCRDGKFRPVESGTFPLVDGPTKGMVYSSDPGASIDSTAEARTMRIRGYGNAINAVAAEEFIKASMSALGGAA